MRSPDVGDRSWPRGAPVLAAQAFNFDLSRVSQVPTSSHLGYMHRLKDATRVERLRRLDVDAKLRYGNGDIETLDAAMLAVPRPQTMPGRIRPRNLDSLPERKELLAKLPELPNLEVMQDAAVFIREKLDEFVEEN